MFKIASTAFRPVPHPFLPLSITYRYLMTNSYYQPVEMNECDSSPCAFGTCYDSFNQYYCDCDPGYTGVNCETGKLYLKFCHNRYTSLNNYK